MIRLFSVIFSLILFGCASLSSTRVEEGGELHCDVAIVGGGPAGVYLAYKLSSKMHSKLCLFEKEQELGGRLRDETYEGIAVGTGARRVNEVQKWVLDLGRELAIEFQKPEKRSQLIYHRGKRSFDPEEFISFYPGLQGPFDKDPSTTRDDEFYAKLVQEKSLATKFPKLMDYMKHVLGKKGPAYLRGVTRFHSDFDYELSTSNYLEYMTEELKTSSVNLYPVGGMNQFVIKMEEKLKANGARVYTGEPLLSFEKGAKEGYVLKTHKRQVDTTQLVLAIPPVGLDKIQGSLAEQIRQQPEFKALLAIPIVVINQWWSTAWWDEVRNPKIKDDTAKVWRAWTTEHCVNHTEIPQEAYAAAGKVTRSVYTDDPKCVAFWKDLMSSSGTEGVEKEVVKGLAAVFNVKVPKPIKTSFHYWPAGWYFVGAGAKSSNKDIANWSKQPLTDQPNLMLLGEAYWPDRPGWSEGAYFSAEALLKAKWNALRP